MSDAPAFLAEVEINPTPSSDMEEEPVRNGPDPDRYLNKAKELVRDNYNSSHDPARTPSLELDQIFITWFTKVFKGWKANLASSEVRNLSWVVSYNSGTDEYYIEIYRRINSAKVKGKRKS